MKSNFTMQIFTNYEMPKIQSNATLPFVQMSPDLLPFLFLLSVIMPKIKINYLFNIYIYYLQLFVICIL